MSDQDVVHELTVCTVVRGDADPVARWVGGFVEQSLPKTAYDLIVIDASPSGGAADQIGDLPAGLRVDVVRVAVDSGPGAAWNVAWQRAQAPNVAFLSVQAVPAGYWVEHAVLGLSRGRRLITGRWTPTTASLGASGTGSYRLWATPREAVPISTEQMAVARKDLAEVGGFDETITDADRCDTDLAARLVESGVEVTFVPRLLGTEDVEQATFSEMVAARRRAVPARRLLRDRPRTRARILVAGFWQVREAEALLAAAGLALALKDRRFALLAAPWVHERTCRTPRAGGARRRWMVLPGVLGFDLFDAVLAIADRFDNVER